MVGLFLALLCGASPAAAWEGRTTASVDLAATASAMELLQHGDELRLAVTGPGHSWLIHPGTGEVVASSPVGGEDLVEGPQGALLVCGQDGITRLERTEEGLGEPQVLDGTPCKAVSRVLTDSGPWLVAAGTTVRSWPLIEGDRLGTLRPLDIRLTGWPLLAVDARRFAVAEVGADRLIEEGPWGATTLRAGGPIGGLTTGPSSWMWSLPDQAALVDVTRRRITVAPRPGALATGDVDGDGLIDIVVAHPDEERLGLVGGRDNTEVLLPALRGVRDLVVDDLDGDGCAEVVTLTPRGEVRVLGGTCANEVLTRAPTPAASEGQDARVLVIGDAWPEVQARVGDRLLLHLQDALGTATAWSSSGGPEGLVVTSAGTVLYRPGADEVGRWRVSVRMWVDGEWARRGGFELTVLPADGVAPSPEQVASGPAPEQAQMSRAGRQADLAAALQEQVGTLRRPLAIRGCSFGFGGSVGFSKVGASWVLLGETFVPSGSPALALACDGGTGEGLWWSAGLDMAPWFVYLVEDVRLRHAMAATVALGWQREDVYVGGYATAGATVLGLGPVVRWLPFERTTGSRHGPEVRVTWMPAREIIVEGLILYTLQLGPYR